LATARSERLIDFGPFTLDPKRRKLMHADGEVRLGGRAMDILLELARNKDQVVSREALVAAAWPDTFVHESNLKVTIAYLRRALRTHAQGEYINTVVGRGYWLGGAASLPDAPPLLSQTDQGILPEIVTVIGRDDDISAVVEAMRHHRLTTIAGTGGIGKTTVAVAASRLFGDDAEYTIVFVDLARVASGEFVLSTVAAALGITADGRNGTRPIASLISDRRILLVLDTCEHVRDAVVEVSNGLLAASTELRVLATSRQVLAAAQEKVLWLSPLQVPPKKLAQTAAEVLRYSAPQLLQARAAERSRFRIVDANAQAIAEICRELDGAPLAIELVASRLDGRSPETVLRELEDRFRTLRRESATGPLRQRTLRLTLEWSYALLGEDEAHALRVLSIFAGSFSEEDALRGMIPPGQSPARFADAIEGLVAKSMLDRVSTSEGRLRMLDTTRAFAAELLATSGELDTAAQQHARLQLDILITTNAKSAELSAEAWRTLCNEQVDDLRKAIDWCLYHNGDTLLGLNLVAAGLPLWQELSLGEESRRNCELALSELTRIGLADQRLKLTLAVGLATANAYLANDQEKTIASFNQAIDLARATGDADAECKALGAFAIYMLLPGGESVLRRTLEQMRQAALRTEDPFALWEQQHLHSFWIAARGHFKPAYEQLEVTCREMDAYAQVHPIRSRQAQKLMIEANRAACAWFGGRPGRSRELVSKLLTDAQEFGHDLTLVYCLSYGGLISLVELGEYELGAHWSSVFEATVKHRGFAHWAPRANCYSAVIDALSGKDTSLARLQRAYDGLREGAPQGEHDGYFGILAGAMLECGHLEAAATLADCVLETPQNLWIVPELHRIRGGSARGLGDLEAAEATLRTSLEIVNGIEIPAFKLRTVIDLASLLHEKGKSSEARSLLEPLYAEFTDGFDTVDLRKARQLLDRLE
jgi:predicted ATPase/DNA-binding winged helix-turn-helix (wHTH) protein